MISIAPPKAVVGATAGRGRGVVDRRVVDDGIDARGVDDGADGREAALAVAACVALTTSGWRAGSVEGFVLGFADSLDATGATVGAAAAVRVGSGADAGAVMGCAGVTAGAMMRSANA
jgi:hypothetical protein